MLAQPPFRRGAINYTLQFGQGLIQGFICCPAEFLEAETALWGP